MVATISDFDRTWKSYKKNYKVIYIKYKNNKRANEILGTDRYQECKFFDKLNIRNSTRACIKNHILTSTKEGEDENH